MLGDRSGVCEICGKGNVDLTNKKKNKIKKRAIIIGSTVHVLAKKQSLFGRARFWKLEVNFRKHPMFNILLDRASNPFLKSKR